MFRNRWLAMLFVALVLAGVTRIVGTGKGDGILDEATQKIKAEREQAEAHSDEFGSAQSDDGDEADDFSDVVASDEDLIDPAIGDDPTPPDEFAGDSGVGYAVVQDGEIILVDNGSAEALGEGGE